MRSLCNMAYIAQVEHLEKDDLRDFDRQLVAAPGEKPPPVSRGTGGLLAMMDRGKKA